MTHGNPLVAGFFDEATNTISYVVQDPASPACAIIDSVLDIDYAAGRVGHARHHQPQPEQQAGQQLQRDTHLSPRSHGGRQRPSPPPSP